jgi:hypothetical protein
LRQAYEPHWSRNDDEIIREQLEIHSRLVGKYPRVRAGWLYLMCDGDTESAAVVYVGKADGAGGLRTRFLHNDNDSPKADHYIGDCRSSPSNGPSYRGIRLKSAELRRRGVKHVVWCRVDGHTERVEQALIAFKRKWIANATGVDRRDPVNK